MANGNRYRQRIGFIVLMFLFVSIPLFLLGIEMVELALLVLVYYYILWCTKKE